MLIKIGAMEIEVRASCAQTPFTSCYSKEIMKHTDVGTEFKYF